ncbi:BRO family protein [Komagataeibacter xylinus]|uniref:BRO-N domain-containing protein n=1 Tax=Komagataeibacter xylinus TaxID=28448 RepID=UPI00280BBC19|nr:BRO family protein [Komagataeibacter xylinus]
MTIETFTKLDGTLCKVRVVEREGKPWFAAADVCTALGLKNPTVTLRHVAPNDKAKSVLGERVGNIVSEAGLYRIVLRCDKPDARPFQDWVTHTVLPTLRKEGAYVRDEEKIADVKDVQDLDALNDMLVNLMKRKTELLEARLAEKEAVIQQQAPKVSPYEDVWQLKLIDI